MRTAISNEALAVSDLVSRACGMRSDDRITVAPWRDDDVGFDGRVWAVIADSGILGPDAVTSLHEGELSFDYFQLVAEKLGEGLTVVPLLEAFASATVASRSGGDLGVPASLVVGDDGCGEACHLSFAPLAPRGLELGADGARFVQLNDVVGVGSGPLPVGRAGSATPGEVALAPKASEELKAQLLALAVSWMLGASRRALADAVRYAGERHQFGRPIGSFQAIQHHVADMHCLLSQVEACAVLVGSGRWDRGRVLGDAAEFATGVARRALQIHGGYGFAMEYSPQFVLRLVTQLGQLGSLFLRAAQAPGGA